MKADAHHLRIWLTGFDLKRLPLFVVSYSCFLMYITLSRSSWVYVSHSQPSDQRLSTDTATLQPFQNPVDSQLHLNSRGDFEVAGRQRKGSLLV